MIVVLFTFLSFVSGGKTHLTTEHSLDGKYTIEFYRTNPGAAGSFGIVGEMDGPLSFKKNIYFQRNAENVEIEWENDHTVLINQRVLNLKEGETYRME